MMHYKYILQECLEDLIRMKVSLSKMQLLLGKTNILNRREREIEHREMKYWIQTHTAGWRQNWKYNSWVLSVQHFCLSEHAEDILRKVYFYSYSKPCTKEQSIILG